MIRQNGAAQEPDEELLYWLALKLAPGLGTRNAARLVRAYGEARAVFRASPTELEAHGILPVVAQTLGGGAAFEAAAQEAARIEKEGCLFITWNDPRFPTTLKEIFDPPVALYARGDVSLLERACLAIVGSRKPTPYGSAVAERLAADLAARGAVVVSGMARGIDSCAHRGALDAGGKTIAVLGCGMDQCYPSENRKLKAQIERDGLVLSEFPLGTFAAPQNFPIRNRVISGVCLGVVVVEAAQYSGSLITARLALEQDREVFAVPGAITNRNSWGPNTLIKQGAKLVQDWKDIVEELPAAARQALLSSPLQETGGEPAASLFTVSLSEVEKALYDQLRVDTSTHIDALLGAVPQYSSPEVLCALLELELKGRVKQLPGKNFVKTL
jgi:DNA processing protein